jgi:hypothetical protein
MKILAVHGLGHQEKTPESWHPQWRAALKDVIGRWNPSVDVQVDFATYDDDFAATPMTVGGTLGGFGRLLWDEVHYSVTDKISSWLGRKRGFGDGVSETVKWKIGMVTQFAEDEKLRNRVRAHLTEQIEQSAPDVIFAHSLGTLVTYDLLLHPPNNRIIENRFFVTCGCQIGRAALRTLFGGRLETVAAREWYNLYNENDDVLVVPFTIYAPNFQNVITTFELPGVGDHDAVEYIKHANTQQKSLARNRGAAEVAFDCHPRCRGLAPKGESREGDRGPGGTPFDRIGRIADAAARTARWNQRLSKSGRSAGGLRERCLQDELDPAADRLRSGKYSRPLK